MKRIQSFFYLTLLGGLAVVLPIAILVVIFDWLFQLVTSTIQPMTDWVSARAGLREVVAHLMVVVIILGTCFLVGLLVKTSVGRWLHQWMDKVLTVLAPGYKTIREIVVQFLGGDRDNSLLNGQVARVKIFGPQSPVTVTSIVTAKHDNGDFTVFVPTAPIPTSGIVYHLPAECVELLPHVSVETAMRTVIACGAGSQELTRGVGTGTPAMETGG